MLRAILGQLTRKHDVLDGGSRLLKLFYSLRIAVHPSGRSYASGGEDGFVRVHHFDEGYFRAKPYGDVGEILE